MRTIPRISVLTAIKNSEAFLRTCLECLAKQTLIQETEIIVVGYKTNNREKEILADFQKKGAPVIYISANSPGLYYAWNLGIKNSRGMYITNLNADDRLKNDALEIMAKALDDNSRIALVYGDNYITTKPNETFDHNSSKGQISNRPVYSHRELLIKCICGPFPMWRRELHKEVGYFDEHYRVAGDYEFWLRIAEQYPMRHIQKVIGLYYKNPKGLACTSRTLLKKECFEIKRKYLYSK